MGLTAGEIFCESCQNRKMAALARIFLVVAQPLNNYGKKCT